MSYETVLADLRGLFGKKSVLYPEDVGVLLGSDSVLAQKVGMGVGLPIKIKSVKGRSCVSIYDMADWLSSADAPSKVKDSKVRAKNSVGFPKNQRPSLGRALLALRLQHDFLTLVIAQAEEIQKLSRVQSNLTLK